jgi:hypothetical protein
VKAVTFNRARRHTSHKLFRCLWLLLPGVLPAVSWADGTVRLLCDLQQIDKTPQGETGRANERVSVEVIRDGEKWTITGRGRRINFTLLASNFYIGGGTSGELAPDAWLAGATETKTEWRIHLANYEGSTLQLRIIKPTKGTGQLLYDSLEWHSDTQRWSAQRSIRGECYPD